MISISNGHSLLNQQEGLLEKGILVHHKHTIMVVFDPIFKS